MRAHHVYVMADKPKGTLYVGVTDNLVLRVHRHRTGVVDGFTHKYGLHTLVWFQSMPSALAAAARREQLMNWHRRWKVALVERSNPQWRDLYPQVAGTR